MNLYDLQNQRTAHYPNNAQMQGSQHTVCPQLQKFNTLLPPGTVISVPKGPFDHYGIVSAYANGHEPLKVISNSGKYGQVVEEDLFTFAENQKITIRWRSSESEIPEILLRARKLIGTPYSMFSSNCEHFVRVISGLPVESPQLRFWGFIGGLAAITVGAIAVAQEDPPKKSSLKKSNSKKSQSQKNKKRSR